MPLEDLISEYASLRLPAHAAVCRALRKEIEASLPKAQARIWHAIPVWFLDENPIVGYHAKSKGVTLLFWNGQAFAEPELTAAGKFMAAQIVYTAASQIDAKSLRRWLKKARTDIWDYKGLRKSKSRAA